MQIVRFAKGNYVDQYHIPHACYYLGELIEVTDTEEYIPWDYYGTPVKDKIWVCTQGQKFRQHSATDFGPNPPVFSAINADLSAVIPRKLFHPYNPTRTTYVGIPLIHLSSL